MGKGSGSGLTRGDRRRNERLARLRELVPAVNAVAGLDLGEKTQALAVTAALEDLKHASSRRARLEGQMIALLDELGIDHERICQIPGLTPAGLAAIVAETGDLRRYASSSSVVKHAGLSPARNESASFHGKAKMSRRGRPALRLAVWRAAWAVLRHCDVLAAKHAALTSRHTSRLADGQARVACAASLLRWIWSLTVNGTRWDPKIAAGQLSHHHAMAA